MQKTRSFLSPGDGIRYSFIHDGQRSVFHTEFGSLISLAVHTEPWHRVQWELKAYSVSSEETLPCCVRYLKCPEVFLYQPVHAVHQSWVRKVYKAQRWEWNQVFTMRMQKSFCNLGLTSHWKVNTCFFCIDVSSYFNQTDSSLRILLTCI